MHELRKLERALLRKQEREDAEFYAILKEFQVSQLSEGEEEASPPTPPAKGRGRKRAVPRTRRCEEPMKFQNVCLIDALRSLGVKVPYIGHGPFWALADGNKMLHPFQSHGLLCLFARARLINMFPFERNNELGIPRPQEVSAAAGELGPWQVCHPPQQSFHRSGNLE